MLLVWMILAQLIHLLSLLPWWWFLIFTSVYYESGFSLLMVTLLLYPLTMVASSVWAWIIYRREKSSRAGRIIAIPIGYILLFLLLIQLGLFD